MAASEQLAGITSLCDDLVKRVANGSLDPTDVKRKLRAIMESSSPRPLAWKPPTWWRTPEDQLARARQLWPGRKLPDPPLEFTPQTKSEVPLLHVPDSFDSLWHMVEGPESFRKFRRLLSGSLRLAPNTARHAEPVWLAFDHKYGRGMRPDLLWGQPDQPYLAASEVLSALIQFPEWPLMWFKLDPAPCLAYQYADEGLFPKCNVPFNDDGNWLILAATEWPLDIGHYYASPSVRECCR